MATDYVLLIHGVDTRSADYAGQLIPLIREKLPANYPVEQIPIYWGDLNDQREAKLLDAYVRAPVWNDLWFQGLRAGDMFRFTGDAALYLSRYVGGAIACRIWEVAGPVLSNPQEGDRLHFVTHSLGTVIVFDLLFSTRWDGPTSLPGYASVQNLRHAIYGVPGVAGSPLVGMPLGSVTTMGSPIGLFSLIDIDQTTQEIRDANGVPLASHDITPRLQIMLKALNTLLKGRRLIWRNYIHPGDPVGDPLQELLPQLVDDPGRQYVDVADVLTLQRAFMPTNLREILKSNNPQGVLLDKALNALGEWIKGDAAIVAAPEAHGSYWTSDLVAQGIADTIKQARA
jgi:hypothetical protein